MRLERSGTLNLSPTVLVLDGCPSIRKKALSRAKIS